jgi:hypothetical protein
LHPITGKGVVFLLRQFFGMVRQIVMLPIPAIPKVPSLDICPERGGGSNRTSNQLPQTKDESTNPHAASQDASNETASNKADDRTDTVVAIVVNISVSIFQASS